MNCKEFLLKVSVSMKVSWSIQFSTPTGYGNASNEYTILPVVMPANRRDRWCNKTQPYRHDHQCNRFWLENMPIFDTSPEGTGTWTFETQNPDDPENPITETWDCVTSLSFYGFNQGLGSQAPSGPRPWNAEDPYYSRSVKMWEMNKYGPINQNYLPNCLVEVQALNPYFPGDRTTVYIGGGTFDDYKNNAIAQLEGGTATLTMEIKDVFPWENS